MIFTQDKKSLADKRRGGVNKRSLLAIFLQKSHDLLLQLANNLWVFKSGNVLSNHLVFRDGTQ